MKNCVVLKNNFIKPGYDESYDGPPPSANDYASTGFEDSYHPQNSFGAASDGTIFPITKIFYKKIIIGL